MTGDNIFVLPGGSTGDDKSFYGTADRLHDEIMELIYRVASENDLPIALALGTLDLVKARIIAENTAPQDDL